MPEVKSDSKPDDKKDQEQEEQDEGISEEERQEILSEFEAQIESGGWPGRSFHSVVEEKLYPLIGEDALSEEEFIRLVEKWAVRNNPHDWAARSFLFDHRAQN